MIRVRMNDHVYVWDESLPAAATGNDFVIVPEPVDGAGVWRRAIRLPKYPGEGNRQERRKAAARRRRA